MSIRDRSDEELRNEMTVCEEIDHLWNTGQRENLDMQTVLNNEIRASNIYYEMRRRGMI